MKVWLFWFLFLMPWVLGTAVRRDRLLIWNVGQGLWTTVVRGDLCAHVDSGGERIPAAELMYYCGLRRNEVRYSHWDQDHIGGLGWMRGHLHRICLAAAPAGPAPSAAKARLFDGLQGCAIADPAFTETRWTQRACGSSNAESRIWSWNHFALFPGDSTAREEALWAPRLRDGSRLRLLILGHHGSRTSTSAALLARLPGLRAAIASARWHRYGHPHFEVRERLRRLNVPLLRTEEWGTLSYEI